jgi:hypothetical protein
MFKQYGMVIPDEALDLMEKLYNSPKNNIKDIIIECFSEYFHNRVGTLLTRTEKDGLQMNVQPRLIPGKLVAYQSRYDEYTWAIYNHDLSGSKKVEILLKDNNNKLFTKDVFKNSLIEHPDSHNISQTSEKNFRLNKDTLIDKYNI